MASSSCSTVSEEDSSGNSDEFQKKKSSETEETDNSDATKRVQTCTGTKLAPPPLVRIAPCICVNCGAEPDSTCTHCKYALIYCKKCSRRANHHHGLTHFRPKHDKMIMLRRHLTLSYYEHIVFCEADLCLESCMESRGSREHFKICENRPSHLQDIVINGKITFTGIGVNGSTCFSCGLFVTCMFLHANDCRRSNCHVEWCQDIRDTFDMDQEQIFTVTDEMEIKCRAVHRVEWKKLEDKKKALEVKNLVAAVVDTRMVDAASNSGFSML